MLYSRGGGYFFARVFHNAADGLGAATASASTAATASASTAATASASTAGHRLGL